MLELVKLPEALMVKTQEEIPLCVDVTKPRKFVWVIPQGSELCATGIVASEWTEVMWQGKVGFVLRDCITMMGSNNGEPEATYPLDLLSLRNIHSAMVYNLEDFRNARDGFGRARDGAWGICTQNEKPFWGHELQDSKIEVPEGSTNRCWHGAIDLVSRHGDGIVFDYQLPVRCITDGYIERCFHQTLIVRHDVSDKHYYSIYQHIVPRRELSRDKELINSGMKRIKVKKGEMLGKLRRMGLGGFGTHLHFEMHSPYTIWDLHGKRELPERTGFEFSIDYRKVKTLHSQFSRVLPQLFKDYDSHYCYNGLALIAHWRGVDISHKSV